jgi:hypothetical protein
MEYKGRYKFVQPVNNFPLSPGGIGNEMTYRKYFYSQVKEKNKNLNQLFDDGTASSGNRLQSLHIHSTERSALVSCKSDCRRRKMAQKENEISSSSEQNPSYFLKILSVLLQAY